MKKTAILIPAMSVGSQLTRDAQHLGPQFVFVITEGAKIREELLVIGAYMLKPASKNGKRKKTDANRPATGDGLLAA